MNFPLIGIGDGDVVIFATQDEARAEMEPPEVKAGLWHVYDRNGQRLEIRLASRPCSTWWPLSWWHFECAELVETGEFDHESIEIALREYLEALPTEKLSVPKLWLGTASFDDLVEQALQVSRPDLSTKR